MKCNSFLGILFLIFVVFRLLVQDNIITVCFHSMPSVNIIVTINRQPKLINWIWQFLLKQIGNYNVLNYKIHHNPTCLSTEIRHEGIRIRVAQRIIYTIALNFIQNKSKKNSPYNIIVHTLCSVVLCNKKLRSDRSNFLLEQVGCILRSVQNIYVVSLRFIFTKISSIILSL